MSLARLLPESLARALATSLVRPIVVSEGGEEGTATGLPFSANFLSGVYTADDGEPSALVVLFGEDADNWGDFDPTSVVDDVGLVGGSTSAPIFLAPTLSELLAGTTYVAEVTVAEEAASFSAGFQIDHFDAPDYTVERIVAFGTGGAGSHLGDAGAPVTFDGLGAGTHTVAFTIAPTHVAVSVDGASVVSVDLSASDPAANEIGIGVASGVTVTLLSAQAAVDDAELPALAGGGLTTIGGFPNSSATPPSPATLWSADFANAVYEMDGETATLEQMFAEDLNYGGWDSESDVYADQGAFFCAPVATPALFDLMSGGATFVITGTPTVQASNQFIGAVNFTDGFDVWDQDCDLSLHVDAVSAELGNNDDSASTDGDGLPGLAPFKIAVTLRGNHIAFSLNGAEPVSVGPISGTWADMSSWGIDCTHFYLERIDCLSWRADEDLPALSAVDVWLLHGGLWSDAGAWADASTWED